MLNFFYRVLFFLKRKLNKAYILFMYLVPFLWGRKSRLKNAKSEFVFIVGAPRTGSTILYQALTNCYEVKYIDNLAASWFKYLPFGMWLSHKKYGFNSHNNYMANHGGTTDFGEHAPSECGEFWYRWFSEEEHYINVNTVSERKVLEIKNELLKAAGPYPVPFIFKNLNMGQRLSVVKKIFPSAKIIFIRRDPRFVVNSIINARKSAGASVNEWWSIKPYNYKHLLKLDEVERCAAQVFYLEKQIIKDLELFEEANVKIVKNNELDENVIDDLARWIGIDKKNSTFFPVFRKDTATGLDRLASSEIQRVVNELPFDKSVFINDK